MRTFELESSLRGQHLEASLRVTCAEQSSDYALAVDDPGVSGFPHEMLRETLQRAIATAAQRCVRLHELAATRSCTELRRRSPSELIARFVDHARFLRRWEPCFEEWLLVTEGVSPPELLPSDKLHQRAGKL